MQYYWIDPLNDSRWAAFVAHHPLSSVFHSPAWLRALYQKYGFKPVVFTTSPPGQVLTNGIPFCRVNSILTGSRLISLPFSDHCQPLTDPENLIDMAQAMMATLKYERLKYIELRPVMATTLDGFTCFKRYYLHLLDLRPSLNEIFRKLHPDCIRRKIRRAEREGLTSEAGRSDVLLDEFYALQVATRHRFGLPPQSRQWFKNVMDAMGENAIIRVARYQGRPVAAIMMLQHKRTAIYKYGCSNASDNMRGGTQLILWQAIEDAKAMGMETMDLGRCDIDNRGLMIFKERWGAKRQEVKYLVYPARRSYSNRSLRIAAGILAKFPKPIFTLIGRLFYRHIA